jgi:hypothetical protein
MSNIAGVLKEEIRRLAKKEIKAQVGTTKQAVARYRSDIAMLKRQLGQQEAHRVEKRRSGPGRKRPSPDCNP